MATERDHAQGLRTGQSDTNSNGELHVVANSVDNSCPLAPSEGTGSEAPIATGPGHSDDGDAAERSVQRAPHAATVDALEHSVEGGCLSNTHPQSSQVSVVGFPEYRASGGFDWFEWAAVAKWRPRAFEEVFGKLAAAKITCQQEHQPDSWVELPGIGSVRVARMGVNRGRERGQHFDFKISYRGVWIGLARRENGKATLPNLFVRQTGRDCLLMGAAAAYAIVCEFIERLGARIVSEKISRADLCLDVVGLDVHDMQTLVEQHHFITSAHNVHPYVNLVSDRRSGFSVGKSPLYLVVYDKVQEQMGKTDQLYIQALIDRRWGGEVPSKAARVEFQVSRRRFVECGIDSPADLFRLSGSLIAKLTQDWFRLTAGPVDREHKHQSRAETLPLWESIGGAFAELFGKPAGPLVPLQREKITPLKLLRQAQGCLRSALLQIGAPLVTYHDFIFAVAEQLYALNKSPADQINFLEEYKRRATEHLS